MLHVAVWEEGWSTFLVERGQVGCAQPEHFLKWKRPCSMIFLQSASVQCLEL